MTTTAVNWQDETRRYDRPHPRLRQVARLIRALQPASVLDLGCATAALRRLLPACIDYCGCDVTDHAAAVLPPDHFLQTDFNAAPDLSMFEDRGIALVHIGGVLEYLERPDVLLRAAHALMRAGAPLIVTIINFEADLHRVPASHHPGWIFKPAPAEVRRLLAETGWTLERQIPVFGGKRMSRAFGHAVWRLLGDDHSLTRRRAEQFIFLARAS